MTKKSQHSEEHMDETWLIPYADLLTLLLALFIVLFASSQVDMAKFKEMKAAFISSFKSGGAGVIGEGGSGVGGDGSPAGDTGSSGTDIAPAESQDPSQTEGTGINGTVIQPSNRLANLQRKFSDYISKNNLESKLHTEVSGQMVMVVISDIVLFDPGSAVIKPDFHKTIHAIGDILADNPGLEVQILGHTDNVPIKNNRYDSNWDLSADRALNFMKILLEDDRLHPVNYAAIGYGEYRPIASNDTAKGRDQNRRVEVVARYIS